MPFLLHHLLERSAAERPDALAIVDRDRVLSYGDLKRGANSFATALAARGVRPGDRVGLHLAKSLESVVAMFGILEAGGVYVPIDPHLPPRRVEFLVRNCEMRAVVVDMTTLANVQALLQSRSGLEWAVVSGLHAGAAGLPANAVCWADIAATSPMLPLPGESRIDRDLAYILYTSGSTGTPKGVMISHQNALTFVRWCEGEFGLRPGDRVSSHAPLHFDLSIFDIFVTIAAGATVYLVPEEYSVFPRQLSRFIRDSGLTVWYSVPSALIQILLHGDLMLEPARNLRLVLFAGEAFPAKYLRSLARAAPGAVLYNLYGPTETNVCTYYRLNDQDLLGERPLPIGKACGNTEVFILDSSGGRVTTSGLAGELWVRGSAVAQGYWGDPARTQSAFVVRPTASGLPDVVYRTGDIVVLGQDGELYLKGRADHMVKSRGYRIELGEIESALYSHPAVKEAAVVAIPDELITNRLRAAVVLMDGHNATERDLKRYLAERLPAYMVPDDIRLSPCLPKTSTGKIDRTSIARW